MCIHYSTLAQHGRVYVILTLEVIKGHWRSIFKNALMDPFVYIHREIIPHTIADYVIFTSNVIKGQLKGPKSGKIG